MQIRLCDGTECPPRAIAQGAVAKPIALPIHCPDIHKCGYAGFYVGAMPQLHKSIAPAITKYRHAASDITPLFTLSYGLRGFIFVKN